MLLPLILIFIATLIGLVLYGPVGIDYDSSEGRLSLTWWGWKMKGPARPRRSKPGRDAPGKEKKKAGPRVSRRRKIGPLFLWSQRDLAFNLVKRGFRMAGRLLGRIEISRLDGDFSTPDPMLNGLLYAALVNIDLSRINLNRARLSANFENRNRLLFQARVRPYQVLLEMGRFLATLPYYRLIKAALAYVRS